ncbi:hypothetical protein M0Q97_04275 [Candidatus Dojkabacteria bacterium]|jgi:hypothetical protein|nr:hypothetical protein [Candidatus Dojkabacteria bacterium]
MKKYINSKDKKDKAFNKVIKSIYSCKTIEQCDNCFNLIQNFSKIFENYPYIYCSTDVLFEELKKHKEIIEKNANI